MNQEILINNKKSRHYSIVGQKNTSEWENDRSATDYLPFYWFPTEAACPARSADKVDTSARVAPANGF